jgi:hypothetical protein
MDTTDQPSIAAWRWLSNATFRGILFVALCVVLANLFAGAYIAHEQYIYHWDQTVYWDKYRELGGLLCSSPEQALERLLRSIRDEDYNDLAILPVAPLFCFLGPSRMAFILAIVNVLLIPSALIGAWLITRILATEDEFGRRFVFPAAMLLFMLLYPVWAPLLEGGRPDILGVGVLFAVLLIYLVKPLAEQRSLPLIWIGILLAAAFLTRRWYAYWAVAFFGAAFAAELLRQQGRDFGAHLKRTIWALITIGLSAAAAVLVVAAPRVVTIVGQNYADAYSAYKSTENIAGAVQGLQWYFGKPLIAVALLGLLALALRRDRRYLAVFLVLQGLLCFLLFLRVQDFNPHHYYLLLPSLFVGWAAFLLIPLSGFPVPLRAVPVAVAVLYLLTEFAAVFIPKFHDRLPQGIQTWMPAVTTYPKVRSDFDQMEKLLAKLETLFDEDPGPIMVNASSHLLNGHLLRRFCIEREPPALDCNAIIYGGTVDSRDGFPCPLLTSKYLVSTSPPQFHLQPINQSVVGLPAADLVQGQGIATAFRSIDASLRLEDGAQILIFERTGPIAADAVDALQDALQAVHPGHDTHYSAERCAPSGPANP